MANARQDYGTAMALLEQSLDIAQATQDPLALAIAFMDMGYLATRQGSYQAAYRHHLESLAFRRQVGSRWVIGIGLRNAGDTLRLLGDYEQAYRLYDESLQLARSSGHQMMVAYSLNVLGYCAVYLENFDHAESLLIESLEMNRAHSYRIGMVYVLAGFAELLRAQGHAERAVQVLSFVETSLKSTQTSFLTPAQPIELERSIASVRTLLDQTAFNAAWEAGKKMTLEQAIEYALDGNSQLVTNQSSKSK